MTPPRKTAEEIAEAIVEQSWHEGHGEMSQNYLKEAFAAALRAERGAALEEAAKVAEASADSFDDEHRVVATTLAFRIRSLAKKGGT